MYKLIQECAVIEDGLYGDVLMDGCSLEVALMPTYGSPVYLLSIDKMVANAKDGYDPGAMRNDSFRVFNTYEEYCRWFNLNVSRS